MTDYTPKVGDLVRRTRDNGTVIEGIVRAADERCATDGGLDILWSVHLPHETILIHRPVEFKTAIGTCYRQGPQSRFLVVRVDDDEKPWVGDKPMSSSSWFTDYEVRELVEVEGWVEFPLTEKEEA